jgi:nucleoside-diphosphate-sugar epimerase
MRLLILGGTVFLGRAIATAALAAGDEVTCAARGTSGSVPDGARLVRIDRADAGTYDAIEGTFDALVDVSSRPSHVRAAMAALADRVGHVIYVSSGSVYTDDSTTGQRVEGSPIHDPATPEQDDPAGNGYANYGPCKVACERAVLDAVGEQRAMICRAGLIVGPEDVSNRFTYWADRVARGGEILAPGAPDDAVQWVDVRDLADWLARAARERISGTYDGIGPPVPRGTFLAEIATGVGTATPQLTWVSQEFLTEREVNPWAGPRSLPLWLPLPDYAGFLSRDASASLAAGLRPRPLAETARDTHDWSRARAAEAEPDSDRTAGLSADEESEVLAAWHATGE